MDMDNFRRELESSPADKEVVLTYRPQETEPVVLRYERELPEQMRKMPETPVVQERVPVGQNPLNPPEKPKKHWGVRLYVGISLLVIVICTGVGIWYAGQYDWGQSSQQPPPRDDLRPWEDDYYYWNDEAMKDTTISIPVYPTGGETRLRLVQAESLPELSIQEVYDKVTPSVVAVLGKQAKYAGVSVGTGVIFSADGYIITNCHVIAGCSQCAVWITDRYGVDAEYEAKVVGYDADADLAVLKVDGTELPAAEFGVSDDLQVGDPVYAIGNPLGVELRNTLTDGIVSAINRDVDVDGVTMTLIQTTAALNSGNSGGPLINQYGQVIGINTIKMMSDYDTIEGLGFAIPSSLALRWVNELIEFGEIQPQPVLGVVVNRIPKTLPDGTTGLLLEEITPGQSGDRAGLRAGDCLVRFAGQDIVSFQQLLNIRRELRVGDAVAARVFRDGKYVDVTMIMMAG